MTVKDVVKIVCEFVGEREILAKLKDSESVLDEREQEKLDIMVNCFNLVNQEIASDYLPYLYKENVDHEGAIINFSDLTKVVINIIEIKNRFGLNLQFKNFSNYVEVVGKPKYVVYSYLPEDLNLSSDVEFLNGLSARVFAYGIASEFLLVEGLSEDAEIWEERFKESLFVLSRKRGEHRLPKRSWL